MKTATQRIMAVLFVLVAISGAWFGNLLLHPDPHALPRSAQGTVSRQAISRLFDSHFADYQGRQQSLAQWQGKILVVNFWATWCPPCREEMPYFSRLNEKYAPDGVQFVGISADPAHLVETFARQESISYPLLTAGDRSLELSKELGNTLQGLPYTLVLGRKREPLLSHTGRLTETELEALLKQNLQP